MLADNLRAVLGCVAEDGEWAATTTDGSAAPGATAGPAPGRMIKAGGMARKVLDAPDQLDGLVTMCGAYARQSTSLRSSLA